ncbi:MAG TPA: carboxypeptidase regulatory-like domain-containing protein [Candidatus Acidoferrales bacterium]|nr:carboxypeptidase regulatory-like domain-containing protein [Candidatus Acidoferrales bacterium]
MEVEMYRLGAVGLIAVGTLIFPILSSGNQFKASESRGTKVLEGTVVFREGNQASHNVTVELTDAEGNSFTPVVTSESGGFMFRGLNSGTFAVTARAEGCEPVTASVDLSFGSERGLVIYLNRKKEGASVTTGDSVSAHELSMPAKARDLMDSGKKKLYDEKSARAALEDFQSAAEAAPNYYEPYYQIGMAEITLGDAGAAEKSFRKSIELSNDKYAEAEIGLGSLMIDKGNYAEGEKAIRRGIELSPTFWLGHYELGRMEMNQNMFAAAEKSADEAKALAPTALIVYRLLSNIHLHEKNYPALLDDLNAYIKLDPKSMMGVHAQQLRVQVERNSRRKRSEP